MNAPVSSSFPSSSRSRMAVLALILAGFIAYVWLKSGEFPSIVATHFDASGKANGWMTRQKHLSFTIALGLLLPLFIVGLFAIIRRCNGWGLNLPHKEYWLAPERRTATFDFMSRQSLWLATLMTVFQAAMYKSALDANQLRPPTLSTAEPFWLGGGLIVLCIIWVLGFIVRFRKPRAE